MKKLITLLLALAKVLRLTACGEQPYSWPATATSPAASRA